MHYFPRHIITTLVLAYFISCHSFVYKYFPYLFFIYLFFLPVSICVLTPFSFFLLSLLCYPSNICLLKQFPLSVLWAEPLNICTLLYLGQGREFSWLLRTYQLIKDFQEKFPTEASWFHLFISKLTEPPSLFFLVKFIFKWATSNILNKIMLLMSVSYPAAMQTILAHLQFKDNVCRSGI